MQGKSRLDEVEHDILEMAAEKGPLSYTQIMTLESKGILEEETKRKEEKYAKLTLLKGLHLLLDNRQLTKSRTRPPRYSITRKGYEALWRFGTDQISTGLQSSLALEKITPEQRGRWVAAAQEAMRSVKITKEMSVEEAFKAFDEVDRKYHGLLARAYRVMHKLIINLQYCSKGSPYRPMFIGIIKKPPDATGGGICMIQAETIQKAGLLVKNVLPGESEFE